MRAVFFDLDGTLVELPDDFLELFESAMADHDLHTEVEHAECYTEEFFDALADCHPEPYRLAMAALREEYDLEPSAESSGPNAKTSGPSAEMPPPSAEALAESYTEREAEMTNLVDGCREALDALDSEDSTLGVLTNGGARGQHRKLAHHGIADYFEAVVVSGDVGAGKPDPEIFAAAKEAVPADKYVFVADDLERDVLPAQEAGFTGVLLADEGDADEGQVAETGEDDGEAGEDDGETGEDDGEVAQAGEADVTISSLREIPALLGGDQP